MSENIDSQGDRGVSRRDLLRRGAVLSGALAWATPVVQVIGMSPALAQESSPIVDPDCVNRQSFYSKYEVSEGEWEASASPHCPGCSGGAANGEAWLDLSNQQTDDEGELVSVDICPKAGVVITSVCISGGSGVTGTVTNLGNGCWRAAASAPAISHVLVCFDACLD